MTVMFSGIVGFAKYCAANSDAEGALKIVCMLNELYTSFDELTDPSLNPNIYKVGCVGTGDTKSNYRAIILSHTVFFRYFLERAFLLIQFM